MDTTYDQNFEFVLTVPIYPYQKIQAVYQFLSMSDPSPNRIYNYNIGHIDGSTLSLDNSAIVHS